MRRERSNSEMETGRRRRSRTENRGHRAVPPRWPREMLDGRCWPGGVDGGGNNNRR